MPQLAPPIPRSWLRSARMAAPAEAAPSAPEVAPSAPEVPPGAPKAAPSAQEAAPAPGREAAALTPEQQAALARNGLDDDARAARKKQRDEDAILFNLMADAAKACGVLIVFDAQPCHR